MPLLSAVYSPLGLSRILLMAKVSVSAKFSTSAKRVWALIGDFDAMARWHPAVEKSELGAGGMLRRLGLAGGG